AGWQLRKNPLRVRSISGPFKNQRLRFRRIESAGHVRIARWIAGDCQGCGVNPVYGVNRLADSPRVRTFENCPGEFLGVGVLTECENSFAPVVSLGAVKIEGISGESERRCAFRFMALVVTGPGPL